MTEQLPVDEATRTWLNYRVAWILDQFGRDQIASSEIVIPTPDSPLCATVHDQDGVQSMLVHLCGKLGLEAEDIDLCMFENLQHLGEHALGMYEQQQSGYRIWIERRLLIDSLDLVAVLAHELCHIHLLGHGRVTSDEDDHEPLTDLLTVFMGFGIITANSALNELFWQSGVGWQSGHRGYLTMPAYGYALALYSLLRDDQFPTWQQFLRRDVRNSLAQSLRYLNRNGLPDLQTVTTTEARPAKLQLFAADERLEAAADTRVCPWCGVQLPYRGTCDDCLRSVDDNEEGLKLQQQREERTDKRVRLGCIVVALILMLFWILRILIR